MPKIIGTSLISNVNFNAKIPHFSVFSHDMNLKTMKGFEPETEIIGTSLMMINVPFAGDVVVARDDEVRDSLTKMMTTKADSGMSGIFHQMAGNFSLRTLAFLLVASVSVILIVSVSIGLICRVQVSASNKIFCCLFGTTVFENHRKSRI